VTLNVTFKSSACYITFYSFGGLCLLNCSFVIPQNRVVNKDQVNDDTCFS